MWESLPSGPGVISPRLMTKAWVTLPRTVPGHLCPGEGKWLPLLQAPEEAV